MRILVLSQYWYPENGVPQRRWTWITQVLQNAGHEVTVIAPPPHYKRSISLRQWAKRGGLATVAQVDSGLNGETILRSSYFPSGKSLTKRIFNQAWSAAGMVVALYKLSDLMPDYHPDIVIGTVPALPTAAVSYVAARKLDVPYVIDLRDAWPALFKESSDWNAGTGTPSLRERVLKRGPFQLLVFFTKTMIEGVLGRASGIITTSSELETVVSAQHQVPTATVRNVFPSPVYVRGKKTVLQGQLNVLYAGTLGRAQRLENALLAAKIARDMGVQVNLRFVGDGATWEALTNRAEELKVDLQLEHQLSPEALNSRYDWADTALVHLTDWESLKVAVPSKTYELMSNGIHISGVVRGETARLIAELEAGDVVAPNDPFGLAQLWVDLAGDRSRLDVSDRGRKWVEKQRENDAPLALIGFLEEVREKR
ncbi:glycosyltransferase family 4 protein [Corynebacterium coyleae]|uniref:glycosyltransferase family 4 protein n=1 Tax=Corynebacterium coyleae TaxID=53374 RepID=UPI00254BC389|nr:glycosyltransferase family 4 protein [Corynebacterium coyleae]MDK8800614.1 glycosyltransferase family 4 protein [Corynebacterium coyleae]